MSHDVIKQIKIVLKGDDKIVTLIKNISKTENLKNIREKKTKILREYKFCDGEDMIDFDIEGDYEIGELIDNESKVYVKLKNNLKNNNNSEKATEQKENQIKEIPVKENKNEIIDQKNLKEKTSNLNPNLIEFVDKISNSKEDLKNKIIQIIEENFITSLDDLVNLNQEDFEIFKLPPLIKKKFVDEVNKLKKKEDLSEDEMKLIRTIFDQGLPPDILFGSLGATSSQEKQEKIKNYYFSLKIPLKPIPTDLKRLIVKTSEDVILPCFKYKPHFFSSKRYYTLLVMGETGSGKTTLLDAFVNYLAGMNFDDQWRYKLVDENDIRDVPPGDSQTSEITSYYVNYQRQDGNEINIRIVDTPGLGDKGGVGKDNEIIKKFEEFFHTTTELDYVLVTVKASTTRWTQNSQYIYDRVHEIFGKDAKNRFILICTFADGKKPLALKVIENQLHYEQYFCFNNSALYTPSESGQNSNTKFFWDLGMQNVKRFFDIILKNDLHPLSLTLTKQVMSK